MFSNDSSVGLFTLTFPLSVVRVVKQAQQTLGGQWSLSQTRAKAHIQDSYRKKFGRRDYPNEDDTKTQTDKQVLGEKIQCAIHQSAECIAQSGKLSAKHVKETIGSIC